MIEPGLLNDIQIEALIGMIDPFVPVKIRHDCGPVISYGLSSYGYDIRLSDKDFRIFVFNSESAVVVDPKRQVNSFFQLTPASDKSFLIPPHSYALGVSVERFNMPDDVLGMCLGKSTYARSGVITPMTPLEPGWYGHLTLEISNSNPLPVKVYAGEGIAQVMFFRGTKPKTLYSGRYQDQKEVVVPATV